MVTRVPLGPVVPDWVRTLRRPFLRTATFLGPRLLPKGRHIVFVSAHADDPDALVILEFLAEHSSRPLIWVCFDQPNVTLLDEVAQRQVTALRVEDPRAFLAVVTSPLVFHTYGLLGIRRAARRQTVVNVWHGDGPKAMRPHPIATTFMVTGVREFGRRRMQVLGLPQERLLVSGRPRVDDIHRGLGPREAADAASQLGLDERPIVWWLPTWREDRSGAVRLNADMVSHFTSSAFDDVRDRYQFIVKPHPNNPAQEWPSPWRVVEQTRLARSETRWYRLLGNAAAIISDYSSVSSDFLDANVPIAFIIPDAESYEADRGFYMPDWREYLPGPILFNGEDLGVFLSNVAAGERNSRCRDVAEALGSNNGPGATYRLFAALSDHGVDWR